LCKALRGMWQYTCLIGLLNIIKASALSTLVIIFLIMLGHSFAGFTRSVLVIDGVVTLLFIAGSRICLRLYFEVTSEDGSNGKLSDRPLGRKKKQGINLLIIGAWTAEKKYTGRSGIM